MMLCDVSSLLCVSVIVACWCLVVFLCQAEDGIRDLVRSRGLGDVYKRQRQAQRRGEAVEQQGGSDGHGELHDGVVVEVPAQLLSLIHI